jgi:hypothetical protein
VRRGKTSFGKLAKPSRPMRARVRQQPKIPRNDAPKVEPFRVLIAVSRPRYRSRSERATLFDDWAVRVLTNKEDPIGLINQLMPDVYVVSEDFGASKKMGMLTAAQRWRAQGLKVVAIFEDAVKMEEAAELYDAALAPPWKTVQLREIVAGWFTEKRGVPPTGGPPPKEDESEQES